MDANNTKMHFELEEPVVTVAMRSPRLSERLFRLNFEQHSVTFEENHFEGITDANYKEKWAQHLREQGFEEDPEKLAAQLEAYYLEMLPESDHHVLQAAKERGSAPYLATRFLGESQRTVVVPGEWLTEFKKLPWAAIAAKQ